MNIYEHKKKLSELFFIFTGICLALIHFANTALLIIALVFVASIFFSLSRPLIDGVYADITARMGRKQEHLIGLTNSSWSIAYIIGPVLAGLTTQIYGEEKTFSIFGVVAFLVSLLLIFVTKRKIKLPQSEIEKWN